MTTPNKTAQDIWDEMLDLEKKTIFVPPLFREMNDATFDLAIDFVEQNLASHPKVKELIRPIQDALNAGYFLNNETLQKEIEEALSPFVKEDKNDT